MENDKILIEILAEMFKSLERNGENPEEAVRITENILKVMRNLSESLQKSLEGTKEDVILLKELYERLLKAKTEIRSFEICLN